MKIHLLTDFRAPSNAPKFRFNVVQRRILERWREGGALEIYLLHCQTSPAQNTQCPILSNASTRGTTCFEASKSHNSSTCAFVNKNLDKFSYHKTGTVPLVIHRSKWRKSTCRSPNQATNRRTIAHLPDNERFWPINRPTLPVKVFIEHIRYPLGP